jgi:hypothetical protein
MMTGDVTSDKVVEEMDNDKGEEHISYGYG